MVCLKILGSGASSRNLEDGAQMGKQPIRSYVRNLVLDVKGIDDAMILNRRPIRSEMGSIYSVYTDTGFTGCIGAVDG